MSRIFVKFVSILCIVLMVGTLFTGCGGQKAQSTTDAATLESSTAADVQTTGQEMTKKEFADKNLEIAVFEGGYGKAYWEDIIKRFEADYPGVKVNLTSNPKIGEVLRPRFVSGNPPDFIYMNPSDSSGLPPAMAKEGSLLDLTGLFNEKALDKDILLKDKLNDGFLDYCQPAGDGKIYYAPFYYGVMGLWYNKTCFEEKGWKAPKTWNEFFAFGDLAKKEGKALYTYQGIYPGYNEAVMLCSIASAGGIDTLNKIFNYEEGAWKADAAMKTLDVFYKIAQNGDLLKGTVAMNHTQAQTEFLKGKALFIPNGSWFEGEMKDAIPKEGFSFGFIGCPTFNEGDQSYASAYFDTLFIPAKAKNIELAKEFLKYQYNDTAVILNAEKSQGVVPIKGAVEMAKPYIADSVYNCFAIFDTGVKPLLTNWKATPKTEINISGEIYNPISSVMNKQMTVEQWIEKIESADAKLRDAIAKDAK